MKLETQLLCPPRRLGARLRQAFAALALALLLLALAHAAAAQQDRPITEIARDCDKFAISVDNKIVCAVPHVKRVKKAIIQRADVWVASEHKDKLIVDSEKFMPVTTPESYIVDSLAWSPDASRITMNMTTQKPSSDEESASGGKAVALLDDEGHEIKVEGSKTRFIEDATNATWLTDNATVVYLIGAGPYKIGRVMVPSGQSSTLFEGHTFDAIVWDAKRNQAYALSQNLSVSGRLALFQLDLMHEGIREITRVETYQGPLNLSPSGKRVAFFVDGDAVEVLDLANPSKPLRVRVGMGMFAWSRDENRILLKRGPPEKSGELIWVGLTDGTFVPALHGLEYHAFAISPNGESIAVTEPGKEVLRVYPLP